MSAIYSVPSKDEIVIAFTDSEAYFTCIAMAGPSRCTELVELYQRQDIKECLLRDLNKLSTMLRLRKEEVLRCFLCSAHGSRAYVQAAIQKWTETQTDTEPDESNPMHDTDSDNEDGDKPYEIGQHIGPRPSISGARPVRIERAAVRASSPASSISTDSSEASLSPRLRLSKKRGGSKEDTIIIFDTQTLTPNQTYDRQSELNLRSKGVSPKGPTQRQQQLGPEPSSRATSPTSSRPAAKRPQERRVVSAPQPYDIGGLSVATEEARSSNRSRASSTPSAIPAASRNGFKTSGRDQCPKSNERERLTALQIDDSIRKTIKAKLTDKKRDEAGIVYILRDRCPTRKHLLKIGMTTQEVSDRQKKIQSGCKIQLDTLYSSSPLRNHRRAEKLAQLELANLCRPYSCTTCKVGSRNHREWFDVPQELAIKTVERWVGFMQQDPYETNGILKSIWKDQIAKMKRIQKPSNDEYELNHDERWERWRFVDPPGPLVCWRNAITHRITHPIWKVIWALSWQLCCLMSWFIIFLTYCNWLTFWSLASVGACTIGSLLMYKAENPSSKDKD